ncbi:hypothetical protein Tco_0142151, partial [Tanacetum coccineum]
MMSGWFGVAVVYDDGVAAAVAVGEVVVIIKVRDGAWRGGLDRSVNEERFWVRRKKSAGKVFRRRQLVAGGGMVAGGGWPDIERERVRKMRV